MSEIEVTDAESYDEFVTQFVYGQLNEIRSEVVVDGEVEFADFRYEVDNYELSHYLESTELFTYNYPKSYGVIAYHHHGNVEDYFLTDALDSVDTARGIAWHTAFSCALADVRAELNEQISDRDEFGDIFDLFDPSVKDWPDKLYRDLTLRKESWGEWGVYLKDGTRVEIFSVGGFEHNHDRPEHAMMERLDELLEEYPNGERPEDEE